MYRLLVQSTSDPSGRRSATWGGGGGGGSQVRPLLKEGGLSELFFSRLGQAKRRRLERAPTA